MRAHPEKETRVLENGRQAHMTETALGITLMILVTIAGQEISHLVHPFAALAVTGIACLSVVLAARAA